MKKYLFAILFCSATVHAEWVKLECILKEDSKPLSIFLNENSNNIYKYMLVGESIYDVSFTPFVIKFSAKEELIGKGNYARYIYRLNRQYGNLNVSLEEGDKFLWQYQCKKTKMDDLRF
jgi:hypothetical protein